MKKILIFILLLHSIQSFSQISLGLTGGVILPAKRHTDALRPSSGYKVAADLLAGSERWKFRTGIEYLSFTLTSDSRSTDPYVRYKTEYIGIPLGLRYIFKGEKINPFIEGSISFMGNIAHKNKLSADYNPDSNPFFVSPALGLGLLFNQKGKMYFSFITNYAIQTDYILKDIQYKNESMNIRFNNFNYCVSIGYTFRNKRK